MRRIAHLLRERNAIDEEIAAVTHRPMTSGHLGEWIAAQIFDIQLERSAVAAGIDGTFVLARCKVVPSTSSGISSARACWTPANLPGSITIWSSRGRRRRRRRHEAPPGRGGLTPSSCSMRGSFAPSRSSAV